MNRRQALQTLFASAAATSLSSLSRLADAAPCPMIGLRPVLWTPAGTQLPPDGALVLTLAQGGGYGVPGGSFFDSATPALRGDRGAIAFETRDVAPIVRLLVPRGAHRGAVTVTGVGPSNAIGAQPPGTPVATGPVVVRYGDAAMALIPAPALQSVRTQTSTSMGPRGGMTYVNSIATLAIGAPAEAAFAFVYNERMPNGSPLCAVPVTANALAVNVFSSGHRCGPPNLNQQPSEGMRVVMRFLDRYGRLSQPSNAVAVTA